MSCEQKYFLFAVKYIYNWSFGNSLVWKKKKMKLLINYTRSLDGKSSADFSVQKKQILQKLIRAHLSH